MMRRCRLVVMVVLAVVAAGAVRSQQDDPTQMARRASMQLTAAAEALGAAQGARDRVAALTRTVQAYEEGLGVLRAGMRIAATRESTLELVFEAKREEVSRLVGVLSAMERSSGPMLLLHPSGPVDTARAGMIVSAITPALQAEVAALRRTVEEVSLLRVLQQTAAETLVEGLRGAQEARRLLSFAVAERVDLPRRYDADPDALRRLVESAGTLESFAAGLGQIPIVGADLSPVVRFTARKGALELPVTGRVLRGFQEADAAGVRRPGLILATLPYSLVTAPMPATIRYVGPLLDYGMVIILEPDDDILMVVAGLDQAYGVVGQVIAQGDAIGLMAGQRAGKDNRAEFVTSRVDLGGAERSETLYIEIRSGETPVDPADWFAVTKDG
jgi:septal ring factor EnvC (AmiA/AmiB activator)